MQSYQLFIISVHEICLNSLYISAVNVHKKSSLQILCLLDEFLSKDLQSSLWNIHKFKKLFDCLLLDTYEVNKDMAFRLIKSSKLTDAFFDSKVKILELINVALQMGNSVRPLDNITAAYMLKVSMLSSNIQDILLQLLKFKKNSCIEEENVFYMIVLLKLYLEVCNFVQLMINVNINYNVNILDSYKIGYRKYYYCCKQTFIVWVYSLCS
jgi:hypothetical protein